MANYIIIHIENELTGPLLKLIRASNIFAEYKIKFNIKRISI